MRTTTLALALGGLLMGCATTASTNQARGPRPSESNDSAVSATANTPKQKELGGESVKIVAKKPPAQKYHFVGRVEARATTGDIVDCAIAADADLRRQAKALGADVVKIDVITPPSEHAGKHSRVVLAGRAYKKSS
ncbi:MAG TPA: hypothetical protein VGL86_22655 [Polyangia bacterium]|jgi:hypothetical protein